MSTFMILYSVWILELWYHIDGVMSCIKYDD